MNRIVGLEALAKIFIIVREQVCSGDDNHPLRRHITVEQMEKYSAEIDKTWKGNDVK